MEGLDIRVKNRVPGLTGFLILACVLLLFPLRDGLGQKATKGEYQYVLIEAVRLKNLGQFNEAIKLYKLILGEKEDCHVAHYELGTIYMLLNQTELARTNLEKAWDMQKTNYWYSLAYINSLALLQQEDTRVEVIRVKMEEGPDEPEWEYQLALAYSAQGKYKKAIKVLERMEGVHGFSEKLTLLKATIFEEQGEYRKARMELDKVMLLFPEALQFKVAAAELCLKEGLEEEAAAYYLAILETDSTNLFALTNLSDHYRKKGELSTSLHYLGRSFRHPAIEVQKKKEILWYYLQDTVLVNDYGKELGLVIEAFLETHPDEGQIRLMAVDHFIQQQDYATALRHLKPYLERSDVDYQLYYHAVLLASSIPDHDETEKLSQLGRSIYPDSTAFLFFEALGYAQTDRHRELVDLFEMEDPDAIHDGEFRFQSLTMLAESLYRLGYFDDSDSLFERLLIERPGSYLVMNNYSYYLAERGVRLDRAKELILTVIGDNPDEANYLDTYAWVLFKRNEIEEAGRIIRLSLEKGGENDPEVNEHAGDIEYALGNNDLARAYYLKALVAGGNRSLLERKIDAVGPENE